MLMQKKYLLLSSGLALLLANSCSTKGNAPGGQDLYVPQVTKAVGGTSLFSLPHTQATTGFALNSQSCSSCGNGPISNVWSLASVFVFQGKVADMNSCMIKAMSKADVIPGLTTGVYKYMTSSSSAMKVKITADGSDVKSFEIFGCNSGTQNQYMSGTNSGGNVTFSLRISSATPSIFVKMDATGVMSGSDWTSKSLTVGYYVAATPHYSEFTIAQHSDYLDISGFVDHGTLGTLDGTDVQLVSRVQLIGNSVSTYALGDGSIKTATGGAGSSSTNWNGDTAVVGSGPTTYDSAVSSATLPSVPSTRTTQYTSSEQWDCSVSSDALNMDTVAASNASLMSAVSACMSEFQ